MSKSLSSLFTKELQKNCSFSLKKRAIRLKKFVVFAKFLSVFTAFPIFMPKCESLLLLFTPSLFLKSDGSDSLLWLFTYLKSDTHFT